MPCSRRKTRSCSRKTTMQRNWAQRKELRACKDIYIPPLLKVFLVFLSIWVGGLCVLHWSFWTSCANTISYCFSRLKLKQFQKFDSAAMALEEVTSIVEGKVSPMLATMLESLKDEKKVSLAVADAKLGMLERSKHIKPWYSPSLWFHCDQNEKRIFYEPPSSEKRD